MKNTSPIRAHIALITLTLLFAAGITTPLPAAIVVLAPTGSTAGSFAITQDITFTITSTSNVASTGYFFVLDEWVTSDGARAQDSFSPLSISKNGGVAQTLTSAFFTDNATNNFAAVTPNDGFFGGDGPSPAVNDTITLKAGTYTLPAISGFNPQGTQTFTGSMFMIDDFGAQISNTIPAVPEPSTMLFGAIGIAGILCRRNRNTRNA